MTRSERTVLALDAHGGDQGLDVSVPAALNAIGQDERLHILLVGARAPLEDALQAHGGGSHPRIEIHAAETVLPMDVKPAAVLRRGRDSSLWKAFERVADGAADACVSGGSTAAMMVCGVRVLGMLEGIQRPALMTWMAWFFFRRFSLFFGCGGFGLSRFIFGRIGRIGRFSCILRTAAGR